MRFVDVNADGKADVVRGYFDMATRQPGDRALLNTYSTTTSTYQLGKCELRRSPLSQQSLRLLEVRRSQRERGR